jgi:hypothetical protein
VHVPFRASRGAHRERQPCRFSADAYLCSDPLPTGRKIERNADEFVLLAHGEKKGLNRSNKHTHGGGCTAGEQFKKNPLEFD